MIFKICLVVGIVGWSTPCNAWEWPDFNPLAFFMEGDIEEPVHIECDAHGKKELVVHNVVGNITVKTWDEPKIVIHARKLGSRSDVRNTAVSSHETHQKLTVQTTPRIENSNCARVSFQTVLVPRTMHVTVTTEEGLLKVRDVEGHITARTAEGSISIRNAGSSVHANAPHGTVKLKQRALPSTAHIFVEAGGDIQFFAMPQLSGAIAAKCKNGSITSTLYITLDPVTTLLDEDSWIRLQKNVAGKLGNGGASIKLESLRGNIAIAEY